MGSQDDFAFAQDFLDHTGIGADSEITMLWEPTGAAWALNAIRVNSAMQLFTHDLTEKSNVIFFNDDGRRVVLDAAPQEPWASANVSS